AVQWFRLVARGRCMQIRRTSPQRMLNGNTVSIKKSRHCLTTVAIPETPHTLVSRCSRKMAHSQAQQATTTYHA
ncbi:hypothetical protein NPIL_464321, partial [Nephila pilipes]